MANLDDLFEGDPEFQVSAADQPGQYSTEDLGYSPANTFTAATPEWEFIDGVPPSKLADHHVSNDLSSSDANVGASYLMSGALPESAQILDSDDRKSAKICPRKAQYQPRSGSGSGTLCSPEKGRSDSWRRLSSLETLYQDKKPQMFDTVTPTESELETVDFQLETIIEEIKCRDLRRALHQADPYLSRQEVFRAYRRAVQQYEKQIPRAEDRSPDVPESGSESNCGFEEDPSPCDDRQHTLPEWRKESGGSSSRKINVLSETQGKQKLVMRPLSETMAAAFLYCTPNLT